MTASPKTVWFGSMWSIGAISQSLLMCIAAIVIGTGILSEIRLLNTSVQKTTCLVIQCKRVADRVDLVTYQSQDRFNRSVMELALQGCDDHPLNSKRSCYVSPELALLTRPGSFTSICIWFSIAVISFIIASVVLTRITCRYIRESRSQNEYAMLTSTNSVAMAQYGATDVAVVSSVQGLVAPSFIGTIYPSLE